MTRRTRLPHLLAACTMGLLGPAMASAADFSADFFSAKGWVKPGETYPFSLSYDAEGSASPGSITVTLPPEATFQGASVTPAAVAGQTLTFNLPAGHGAGRIIVNARSADLGEDPTIIWKNLSAQASYSIDGQTLAATTLGPKVTTLESARYGIRPFPLVMVEYQDVHHCTGEGTPFPECTGNHTAEALDEAVNSRTSGRSLWQLFQDMSFGQLSPEGQVGPIPGTQDTGFDQNYNWKWSTLEPSGTCNGATTAPPSGEGAPLNPTQQRIVNGWYRLPGTQGYYGSDKTGHGLVGAATGVGLVFGIDDACGPTAKITYDAAAIADPELDYNEFDTDKDGVVDFFNVAFAGEGGNGNLSATGLNNIWPHKSDLQYYFTDENGETGYVSNDQLKSHTGEPMYWTSNARDTMTTTDTGIPVMVRVGPYNVNPEAAIEKMSVIAHEYGHSLGLPDFYSLGNRETFGSWELMASDHSQFMTVFTRQDLGWIVPKAATDGSHALRESKTDTGEIHWQTPAGTPYVLSAANGNQGIHNADALKFPQPTIKLIDSVPSGVRAWHSGAGNDFGCPVNSGHTLDVFMPEFQQLAAGTNVELSFQSLYEIEWDWDYAFLMVSTDGGNSWATVPSNANTTLTNEYNPNNNDCFGTLNNAITGVSGVPNQVGQPERTLDEYPEAEWITDSFDLSAYAGNEGPVIIRFGYFTDAALTKRGWFIDDINVSANGSSLYSSDFEGTEEEHTRLFPRNFSRISSSAGVDADHAYYVELRDRVSWDFDGKDQSERGAPSWEPGVAILYTDESHGYGNTGVDNPPAQTIVDSQPAPEDDSPNLDDAAYTGNVGRDEFNGCTHVDNYDTPDGVWKLPTGARVFVDGVSGLSGDGTATGTALANVTVVADPQCDLNTAGPVLSIGAGYEDPDTNGSYELTWVPTPSANGPNQLQEATNLDTILDDDAEDGMDNWDVASDGLTVTNWDTVAGRSNSGDFAFYTVLDDDARNTSNTMTWHRKISIPADGQTLLNFHDWFGGELDDQGFVEVSIDDGDKWFEVYSTSNPILADEAIGLSEPLGARQVDLSAFAGDKILLRFRYFVGASNYIAYTPIGWWVDDVRIDTADWTDIALTTDTSFVRSGLTDDHYYYRVRSSHTSGGINLATDWSNIVETDVERMNQAPHAENDQATTDKDTAVTIDVLANDSDPDGDTLSIGWTSGPNNGDVTVNGDDTLTYTPDAGFIGTDAFVYQVNDGQGGTDYATVSVTVQEQDTNTAPNAVDDAARTQQDTAVSLNVLGNDSDADGDALTVTGVQQPLNGSVTWTPSGMVTYTPDAGFVGNDAFDYSITDGNGGSASAQVVVAVSEEEPENTNPVAANDSAETDQDMAVTINVLANDSDADGDSLTVTAVSQGSNGSVVRNADNRVTYTPAEGFSGSDSFSYTISDGHGGSATATVSVTVHADPDTGGTTEGRVHGSGHWDRASGDKYDKIDFSFDAKFDDKKGLKGKLKLHDKDLDLKIDAKHILSLSTGQGEMCDGVLLDGVNSFSFTAVGELEVDDNTTDNVTFRGCGIDNGKHGKGKDGQPADVFHVEVVGGGYSTGARTPDSSIDGGNVHLHDAIGTNAPSAGNDGSKGSDNQAMVLDLDPLLVSSVPAGTTLALTSVAHTPAGLALPGTPVVMLWSTDSGANGELTALTNAAGVAVFTMTVPNGDVVYSVRSGELDSNAVRITGF